MTQPCSLCHEEKPLEDFHRKQGFRNDRSPWCRPCTKSKRRQRYAIHADQYWSDNLRYKYGLTVAEYEAMFQAQDGRCALCRKPPAQKRLHVDHDHSCCPGKGRSCGRCRRGLLCGSCNLALGNFGDDAETLQRAAEYVRWWKEASA